MAGYMDFVIWTLLTTCGTSTIFMALHLLPDPKAPPLVGPSGAMLSRLN
jgi:hypothetical protein